MTVLNFPSTAGKPTDGSFTYTANGVVYRWDGEKWAANTQSNAGSGGRSEPVHFDGPDAPDFTSLIAGDQWYNTNDGRLYTYTLNASNDLVWIDASPDSQVPQFWERNGTTLEPTTAGDSVDIGSGNIQLNADGSTEAHGRSVFGTGLTSTQSVITVGASLNDVNRTVDIKRDGSANFASAVAFGTSKIADQGCIYVQNGDGSNRTVDIKKDGSATFGSGNITLNAERHCCVQVVYRDK